MLDRDVVEGLDDCSLKELKTESPGISEKKPDSRS